MYSEGPRVDSNWRHCDYVACTYTRRLHFFTCAPKMTYINPFTTYLNVISAPVIVLLAILNLELTVIHPLADIAYGVTAQPIKSIVIFY